ncbi:hypothetical protein ACM55K_13340 [Flavobacterium sp. LT1R49]|uniref:hypothetical protein n=1 Tax=Flavobacterium arabinosi TaxID=3398737 RepID=UPI003A89ED2C
MIIKKLKFVSVFLLITVALCYFSCNKDHSKNKAISTADFLKNLEIKIKQKPDSVLFFTTVLLQNASKNTLNDEKLLAIFQLRQKAFATLQNMDSVLSSGEAVRKIASRIPDLLALAQSLLITVEGNVDYGSSKKLEKYLPGAITVFKKRNMLL